MHFIPLLDCFLAVFFVMNLALALCSGFLGRAWGTYHRAFASGNRRQELLKYFPTGDLDRWSNSERAAKAIFWSGLLNGVGIALARLFVLPFLW